MCFIVGYVNRCFRPGLTSHCSLRWLCCLTWQRSQSRWRMWKTWPHLYLYLGLQVSQVLQASLELTSYSGCVQSSDTKCAVLQENQDHRARRDWKDTWGRRVPLVLEGLWDQWDLHQTCPISKGAPEGQWLVQTIPYSAQLKTLKQFYLVKYTICCATSLSIFTTLFYVDTVNIKSLSNTQLTCTIVEIIQIK